MKTINLHKILEYIALVLFVGLIITIVVNVTIERIDYLDNSATIISYICCLLLIGIVLRGQAEVKKRAFLIKLKKEGKILNMDKSILERLINKNVLIHTVDDYIEGTVFEVTENTVIVKKMGKEGNVKNTYYVNSSMIMSIEEKNK